MRIDGPTPAGGAYAEAIWTSADGRPVDLPEPGATGEIVEYDASGMVLARTYGRIPDISGPPSPSVLTSGADDSGWASEATDGMKATWDVRRGSDYKPVETLEELIDALGLGLLPGDVMRETIAAMLRLPSWQAAPVTLRAEVSAWLEASKHGKGSPAA